MRKSKIIFVSFERVFEFFRGRNNGYSGYVMERIEVPDLHKLEIRIVPVKTRAGQKRSKFWRGQYAPI